jgi:streptomycin 6-kinase
MDRFETVDSGVYPSRSEWDARAAELVATMLHRWSLTPREPFVGGAAAAVLRVSRRDGSPAVLKVGYPHVEALWEAVGLEALGQLAPAVYRQDAWTWSLLLEDIVPGTTLGRAGLPVGEALAAGGELLRRVHARDVPAGIPSLAEAMGGYAEQARQRMPALTPALNSLGALEPVARAIAMLEELADTAPDTALLHGDFNPGNILLGSDGGWRVVDPKPMHGDPAFDVWPLAAQLGPHQVRQLAVAAASARVDLGRATAWSFARSGIAVSWALAAGEAPDVQSLSLWASAL